MKLFSSLYHTAKTTLNAVQKWQAWAKSVKPNTPFDPQKVPAPFDYGSLESWAAHPHQHTNAMMVPPGEQINNKPKADVFFVHPTTFFGKENWNQAFGQDPPTEIVDEIILPSQTSVFNGSCRIFAPYYRQATFYVFLKSDENSANAMQLAYDDVVKAFKYYLEHHNNGRPFFIAGHSQGTMHAIRLLEGIIEPDKQLVKQMVAAYAIGFQFPIEKFDRTLKNIRPSQSPTDLHTVIAWDTFCGNTNPKNPIDRSRHFYTDSKKWELRNRQKNFGINPLTFASGYEMADASKNLGAVHAEYSVPFGFNDWWTKEKIGMKASGLSAPYKNAVSAELRKNNFLYISEPQQREFKLAVMPGNNYHNYDYALFYMNLRKNIKERLEHYVLL